MVSQTVTNVMGIIGGVVLAMCQAPQLVKLWRTQSASDLSYYMLTLYFIGLFFITVYLYLEKATVGWICEAIETSCGLALIFAKLYLDRRGADSCGMKQSAGTDAGPIAYGSKGGGASHLTLLSQQPSRGHTPDAGSSKDSSSHGSNGATYGVVSPQSGTHAGDVCAAVPGGQLRERRRSHDALPI